MAEKKNSGFLVDDMRDYALITLMKTIRRLELLDEKRSNESDIAKIRRYVGLFVHKAFNGKTNEDAANTAFDKFPEILEIYEEKDEKTANEMTRELMKSWRKALLSSIPEYKKLSENDCETVILNAEKVYNEVFKPSVDTHNKSRRNKDNQINREEFVSAVMNGEINEDIQRIVLSAKENVIKKLQERKNKATQQPLFIEEINSIVPGLQLNYSISRNSDALKQANRKVRSYFSKVDAAAYRRDYPNDFTARTAKEGSKEDALKYLGYMAEAGYRQIHLGVQPSPNDKELNNLFDKFVAIMKKNYPKNTDEVINKAFGIRGKADKEAQLKAFADKSASFYTQMFGGLVQLYTDTMNKNPTNVFPRTVKQYIDGMQNGRQDVHIFSMFDLRKDTGNGSIKSQQSGEQYSNLDHSNIPVAAAIPLYIKLHPELGGALDPNKLELKQLLELAELAAPLINHLGNHRLVISKSVNNELEANGKLILGAKKDNSVLAVSYSLENVNKALKEIFGNDTETCKRYMNAFTSYTKSNKRGVITTDLTLPEAPAIAKTRKENSAGKDILGSTRIIIENALNIEK